MGSPEFWVENTAQIVSVLLEAFRPESTPLDGKAPAITGFTPISKMYPVAAEDKENRSGLLLSSQSEPGWVENMHISCKALQQLMKYRLQNFKV